MSKNYQSNRHIKNANSTDSFSRSRDMSSRKKIQGKRLENLKDWVTLYRNNPQILATHYLGVNLYPYQEFFLYLISHSTKFLGLASRASAKSFLIGLWSIIECILRPHSRISLSSSTKAQAGLIISQHIQKLYDGHPNIRREISKITTNENSYFVNFHNGSKIFVAISSATARGRRANVVVLEERRLIPTEIISSVLIPFLEIRTPPFKFLSKYKDFPIEEPKTIIISSVFYKSMDWYKEAMNLMKILVTEKSKDIKVIFLDYLITLEHNIKSKKLMELEEKTLDSISWSQEYLNIPFGGSARAYYKTEFFKRSLKRAWLPRRIEDGVGKNKYDIPRQPGEIRIMGCDLAFREGSSNDASVLTLLRCLETKKGYKTEVVYIESFSGRNSILQALRIKQLFFEFAGEKNDIVVLDIANAGISVLEMLGQVTRDDDRDCEYLAMTIMEHPEISEKVYTELSEKCLTRDAFPYIFPISASAALNSTIATVFRDRLKRNMIKFLVDENVMEDHLIRRKNKDIISHNDHTMKAYLLSPSIQTNLLINECVSLDMSYTGGGKHIKLSEPNGFRKDRFSSLSYANYYISLLDNQLLKEGGNDDLDTLLGAFYVT